MAALVKCLLGVVVAIMLINDNGRAMITRCQNVPEDKLHDACVQSCPKTVFVIEKVIPPNIIKNFQQELEEIAITRDTIKKHEDNLQTLLTYLKNMLPKDPPKSCDYIKSNQSGVYLISPDPENVQPFNVTCDFSKPKAETIIRHDSQQEIQVSPPCHPAQCYKRKVNYEVSMPQIISLIQISSNCKQFIKYRCSDSPLDLASLSYGTWLSRDGIAQQYWGGATSQRNGYCACGETGTCDNRSQKCNCDKNNDDETSDEGYLTDKDTLPVTELRFGEALGNGDSGERGWHTLGPMICSGRIVE